MSETHLAEQPIFSNGFVTCFQDFMFIHWYYFPFGKKRVNYSDIRTCELRPIAEESLLGIKTWGMALTPIWWHCDSKRFSRQNYVRMNVNQWPDIGLTMDDRELEQVYYLIRKQMNNREVAMDNDKVLKS
jgi:hypothetical protein